MMLPCLALIVAMGRNRGIGLDNRLPWRIAADMKHFRALTMGKPVIMGRKTWQSVGRPLPGRALVVVSGDPAFPLPPGIVLARDPDEAVERAQDIAVERGVDEMMVAGGATLYADLIGRAERLYVTEIDLAPEADTFFPAIDPRSWRETARQHQSAAPGDDAAFAFVTYERR